MKQIISTKELNKLTEIQQDNLRNYINTRTHVTNELPILTIGKMIEILQDSEITEYQNLYDESIWRVWKNGMWHDHPIILDSEYLCDQLWEVVKQIL